MNDQSNDNDGLEDEPKSKTRRKKEMNALQDFGEDLTRLNREKLLQLPLPNELLKAIEAAQGMKKREARRRQMQYIGKLMRNVDADEIRTAYEELQEQQHRAARRLHLVEQWRDELIDGDDTTVARFIDLFPHVDRQQLRQLVRAAHDERARQKPPAQARKLFRFLRETLE